MTDSSLHTADGISSTSTLPISSSTVLGLRSTFALPLVTNRVLRAIALTTLISPSSNSDDSAQSSHLVHRRVQSIRPLRIDRTEPEFKIDTRLCHLCNLTKVLCSSSPFSSSCPPQHSHFKAPSAGIKAVAKVFVVVHSSDTCHQVSFFSTPLCLF